MLNLKTSNITGNFALDMVELLNVPTNIKDASTRRYIHSNELNLEIYGLPMEQLIGKTILDLDDRMKTYWGHQYAQYVTLDDQVVTTQQPVEDIARTILSISGLVRVQRMVKLPIISKGQLNGVFTFCHNIKLGIKALHLQYLTLYPKKIAVIKFLEHLKLTEYFLELPTDSELKVLIERTVFSRNKELSASFNLAPKTIENHLLHLRYKICNGDLLMLLSVMRNLDIN